MGHAIGLTSLIGYAQEIVISASYSGNGAPPSGNTRLLLLDVGCSAFNDIAQSRQQLLQNVVPLLAKGFDPSAVTFRIQANQVCSIQIPVPTESGQTNYVDLNPSYYFELAPSGITSEGPVSCGLMQTTLANYPLNYSGSNPLTPPSNPFLCKQDDGTCSKVHYASSQPNTADCVLFDDQDNVPCNP
jgi:hypothetical protein